MAAMEIGRIAELLHPFAQLTQSQLQTTLTYIDLLQKWNARINLTAIRGPEEMVTRHFGESYFAGRMLLTEDQQGVVIDLGSGAGFPGLPLAIFRPQAAVVLLESNGKKAAFLAEAVSQLGLKNVEIFRGRGEAFSRKADLVVMRAVENFERALRVAADLVNPGGRLGLLIGRSQLERAKGLLPNVNWDKPVPIPHSDSRILLVGKL